MKNDFLGSHHYLIRRDTKFDIISYVAVAVVVLSLVLFGG